MKMRTKKLTTLFVAAAMSVSALPFASLGVNAEDAGGSEYYMYIATKDSKDARQREITISKDDLSKGDYKFRAAIYIDNPDLGLSSSSDWPTTIQALWVPYDSQGNEDWNDIHFSNHTALCKAIDETTTTLSDGTSITGTYPLFCLSPLGRKGDYKDPSAMEFYSESEVEEDLLDGNTIYADGKGGCYFDRKYFASAADKAAGKYTEDRVTPTVEVDANNTATLTWTAYDKSTFSPVTATQKIVNWNSKLAAGSKIPAKNNSHNWSYTQTKQTIFKGASSDELSLFDFDVTVDADTPDGTYYVGFDSNHETTIVTQNFKSYWPDNLNFIYTKSGDTMVVSGADKNDKSYWLKITVGDGSAPVETTTTTTATTTKPTETTTTTTKGTDAPVPGTSTPSTPDAKPTGYAWIAGEYFVAPGDEIEIAPTIVNADIVNDKGGVSAWGFDFDETLLITNGVLTDGDYEAGTAYGIPGALGNMDELHGVAASSGSTYTAADGDTLMSMYFFVADKDAVVKAAEALGLAVQSDAEHGTYYAFPLNFDPTAPSPKDDNKCAVKIGEDGVNYPDLQLVDGHVNIMIEGLTPSETTTTAKPTETTTTTTTTTAKPTETTTTSKTTTGSTTSKTTTSKTTTTTVTVDPSTLTPFYGDLNLDGSVSVIDVIMLSKATTGKLELNAQQKLNANCKKDDKIDAADIDALLNFICEFVDALPL